MAERPRGKQPIRFDSGRGRDDSVRRAPPPRPPIQYTQSGNMKGYEEEIMPPRPVHTPVDNGIEFPTQPRQTPPAGRRRPTQRKGQPQRNGSPRRPARKNQAARPLQSAARREGTKKRKITRAMLRRRRLYRRLTALLLLVAVVAAGIYLTMTMLFKISAIEVRNAEGELLQQAGAYSSEEVLQVLGLQLEENIFSFSAEEKEAILEQQLPLLEQIDVIRRYPGTVEVRVTPAVPTYAIQTSAGWLTISANLKVISSGAEQPDLPVLYGGEPASTQPGVQLSYLTPAAEGEAASGSAAASQTEGEQTDTRLEVLQTILGVLSERGLLAGVTRIEFEDPEQIAFLYEDRISVLLGTLNGLDYKMDYTQYLLLNTDGKGCAPTDTGALDCSHLKTDGTLQAIFAQGEPELPSGYVVPEPVPEPEPPAVTADPAAQPETTADPAAPETSGAETTPETAQPEAGQTQQTETNQ